MAKIDVFDTCLICGSSQGLERHHVFYGSGLRQLSEKHGIGIVTLGCISISH